MTLPSLTVTVDRLFKASLIITLLLIVITIVIGRLVLYGDLSFGDGRKTMKPLIEAPEL